MYNGEPYECVQEEYCDVNFAHTSTPQIYDFIQNNVYPEAKVDFMVNPMSIGDEPPAFNSVTIDGIHVEYDNLNYAPGNNAVHEY